jgi:predicted permease
MATDDETLFWMDGQQKPSNPNDMKWALHYVIEPDYLKAMRIPLKAGRFFTAQDDEHAPLVIVIDEVLAKLYFGNENPVGKRLNLEQYNAPAVIIGVVGHVKQWGIDSDDTMELRAQMYRSFMQLPDPAMMQAAPGTGVIVRSAGAAPGMATSIRDVLQGMNSQQVIYGTQSMESIVSDTFADRRFSMTVLGVFAGLALLLASVGIYGIISYLVGQRVHEIGIRMALGAQRGDVLRLVLGQGARMALIGVGIGLIASVWLTKLISTMLFGVSSTDPLAFGAAAVMLTLVALAACYIPARRAMRVDPIIALRCD